MIVKVRTEKEKETRDRGELEKMTTRGPAPRGGGGGGEKKEEERRRKKKKEGERERKIRFETELVIKYCVKRLLVIISQKKNFLILNYSAIWHHPDLERDEKAEKRR